MKKGKLTFELLSNYVLHIQVMQLTAIVLFVVVDIIRTLDE